MIKRPEVAEKARQLRTMRRLIRECEIEIVDFWEDEYHDRHYQ